LRYNAANLESWYFLLNNIKAAFIAALGHKGLVGCYNLPIFCSEDIFRKRKHHYETYNI
jgi:hypothetical protein